jgi:hypothetical protein
VGITKIIAGSYSIDMSQLTVKNIVPGNIKAWLLLVFTVIALASCKSNNEIVPFSQPADLNVVNADTAALNFYQNGARLNNISSIASGSQSGYIAITLNSKIYQVKKAGATDYLINNYQPNLDTTAFYTLFIAGETADKLFLITDDTFLPDSTTVAQVRFVNASSSATNLDIHIGNLNFSNQAFKAASGFNYIKAGITPISVYEHGTNNLLFNTTVTLTANDFFTVHTQGIPGGSGQNKLSAVLTISDLIITN